MAAQEPSAAEENWNNNPAALFRRLPFGGDQALLTLSHSPNYLILSVDSSNIFSIHLNWCLKKFFFN